ncbi:MAG: hypothetical protein ABJJ37_19450, partial [Roseibium sp.]
TTLAPIRDSGKGRLEHTSFTQNVRIALAKMPTAMQSPATQATGNNSPFARNKRNHLARMFVLNDVVYNGRIGQNALAAIVSKQDPTDPQPVDRLNTSYVVFCADIDAIAEDGAPLPIDLDEAEQKNVRMAYARELWNTMEDELREVYVNCVGFDGVETADDFATYLEKCHVKTTMPFHDYYLSLPKFNVLPLNRLLIAVAIPAAIAIIALLLRIFGVLDLPGLGWSTFWTFVCGVILSGLVAVWAVQYTLKNGEKPLGPGEYDDLPSVLKALYMQQKFSDFVVDHQGSSAKDLHAAFGKFLSEHKPKDREGPTQGPGLISSAVPASKS